MTLKRALLWVSGLAVITAGVFYLGRDEVIGLLGKIDPVIVVLLFLLQVITLAMTSYQWQMLLKKSEVRIPFVKTFGINLAGNYIESVTPSVKLGGEAARVYLFKQHTSAAYTRIAGIMLAVKYYSLLPFVILAGVSFGFVLFMFQMPVFSVLAFFLVAAFFAVFSWFHLKYGKQSIIDNHEEQEIDQAVENERLNERHGKLSKAFLSAREQIYRIRKFSVVAAGDSRSITTPKTRKMLVTLSLIVWLLYPVKVFIVSRMLGLSPDVATVVLATFSAYLISMLPLLPGGLGSFEGSMAIIFSLSGLTPAEGLAIALATRLVTFWFPLALSAMAISCLTFCSKQNITILPEIKLFKSINRNIGRKEKVHE